MPSRIVTCLFFSAAAWLLALGPLPSALLWSQETKAKPKANRLAKETSPYLLLHAHNPVDWYPWGPQALAKARAENKLIFLSIGYSSCYWCHVMERESFMDAEIAAFLNKHFVCIKVDREERPDIDEIYMTALQVYYQVIGTPSSGGWPLSMFLTPETEPVAGGTYFPARDRDGRDGFLSVLGRIQEIWQENPDSVKRGGGQLADFVRQSLERERGLPVPLPDETILNEVQQALVEQYDQEHGGFGYNAEQPRRPKFPEPSNLVFLLDRVRRHDDAEARAMLVATLERMARGGIRDHLGGGFHRYSTDRYWHIPHFEKMLYDNGQLASVYAEAWLLTGREEFKQVTDELLSFVLRELTSPEGGFYAALDAETNAVEGQFYVWQKADLEKLLATDEFELLAGVYGVEGEPNFATKHGDENSHYTLLMRQPPEELAKHRGVTEAELERQLQPVREKLFAARSKRPRPLTDTKVLTGWNGLMIRGFADAGRALDNEHYVQVAERAAEFVLAKLRADDGRLLRSYAGGEARLNAYLDDYAFLADGLIALHQATGERRWLKEADAITAMQIQHFWDEKRGGFYYTSSDHEELIARSKDPIDSATPAGSGVAAGNLVYLGRALNRPEYLQRAEQTIADAASTLTRLPAAMPRTAVSLAALLEAKKSLAADPANSAK